MRYQVGGKRRSWRLKKKWHKSKVNQCVELIKMTLEDFPHGALQRALDYSSCEWFHLFK